MSSPAVAALDVSKAYHHGLRGRRVVLRGVTVSVEKGEVLALTGENGAGKTTLLKLFASLLLPDSGSVTICGDPGGSARARARVGFASGEERSFYLPLSARENLRFFAALHGLDRARCDARVSELEESLGLSELLDLRVDRCSSGMRARLGIARAVLHRPAVLLLDEPTKSLDPAHAERLRAALRTWAGEGTAIVLATHAAEDARALGARVAVVVDGSVSMRGVAP
jgi:ABC-2 type transport system ATP-binding protein